jgi:hypothetical protein
VAVHCRDVNIDTLVSIQGHGHADFSDPIFVSFTAEHIQGNIQEKSNRWRTNAS